MVVFLLPFVVMSAILYQQAIVETRQSIEQSSIEKLGATAEMIDERNVELETIATNIAYNKRLTPYMINHPFYQIDAINELKNYQSNNSFIEDLFIHYLNDRNIYSSRGLYSTEYFF